ncbi:MAG: hypothetical protein ACFFCQ_10630, partial [Promethearchaeota archaeon]
MLQNKTPPELLLSIIKEKHTQLPNIMEEQGIDCWIIFVRETAGNPDPVMNLIVGGDIVWESAFIFLASKGDFCRTAIVGNFDAPSETNKGIWDEVIAYTEGITPHIRGF